MGFINLAEKTINAKLVYYGCGMGGKTTSLQVVHEIMRPRNEVQLVSIKTEEDATLLFDFLPIDIGEVEGFKVRIQGFTVPGQPKYRRMRKYVLSGADADLKKVEELIQPLDARPTDDGMEIHGRGDDGPVFEAGTVDSHGDHRIAMAFALAGLMTSGITILDPGCVSKTFPGYWDALESLGVELRVRESA